MLLHPLFGTKHVGLLGVFLLFARVCCCVVVVWVVPLCGRDLGAVYLSPCLAINFCCLVA